MEILICLLLPSIHPRCFHPVHSGPSGPSSQSGPSLQANFYHTVKLPKGIILPRDLIIMLPHLKIDIDTMTHIMIHNLLTSPFVTPSYHPRPPQTVIIRYTLRQFLPYQPLLLLMTPHLILRPPQIPLSPDNSHLHILLNLMLPSLSWLEKSPFPRPTFLALW